MEVQQLGALKAYKRSPGLSNSSWYKGFLVSQMAASVDNDGAFNLAIAKMRRGSEPPPHVHSREHEFFYLLSGEMKFFVGSEVFTATAGECMFLPCHVPHGFLVTSEEAHQMLFTAPGGFLDAINKMNVPAERMEVPTEADAVTYAEADLTDTIRVFDQYGIRFLTADEIHTQMPQYPLSGPVSAKAR